MLTTAAKLALANLPSCPPDDADGARWRLSDHLDATRAQRELAQDHQSQWRRLKLIQQAEADARAALDAIRARDVKDLSDQLTNPKGLLITVDHTEIAEAERELSRATREADVARGCEADTSARLTESTRSLGAMEQETRLLVAAVLIEDAGNLAAEIGADSARLRTKHARLQALTRFIDESKLPPRLFEQVPTATHPDAISPDGADVRREAESWRRFAERLAADPAADMQEE